MTTQPARSPCMGIPVLTEWNVETLQTELANDLPAFYVLTNSRAMPLPQAQALNAEIGRNVAAAMSRMNEMNPGRAMRNVAFISRSDSTLRGHFPGEVDALAIQVHGRVPPYVITPAFMAGGRYTVGDVHYVAYGDALVPAGETEFARDAAFGYRASNLREWVEGEDTRRHQVNRCAPHQHRGYPHRRPRSGGSQTDVASCRPGLCRKRSQRTRYRSGRAGILAGRKARHEVHVSFGGIFCARRAPASR